MKKENASLVMGYWQYASLVELHQHSRTWLSEITFWREELHFMQKLVNNHFAYFIDAKRSKKTTALTNQLQAMENQLVTIEENVVEHEKRLKRLLELEGKQREDDYRNAHGAIDNLLNDFLTVFKNTKKTLFKEADEVLKEEKMLRIISLAG